VSDINDIFGARILRERTRRTWTLRDLAAQVPGLSYATVNRAETARGSISLANAARIAAALSIPLAELVCPVSCLRCDGRPWEGFTCGDCGRTGAEGDVPGSEGSAGRLP
jgi:transcriptional regulator with XRE-family HTH domain